MDQGRVARMYPLLARERTLIAFSVIAVVVKVALSAISLISYDVIYLLGFLVEGWVKTPAPWVLIAEPFYKLWMALPIDHPNLGPWIRGVAPPPLPAAYSLVLLIKLPILVADVVCAFLVKGITAEYGGRRYGVLAATVWLLNPYVLLTGDMQGSVELIPVAFTLAGILFLKKKRVSLGSIVLGLGVALKLFPIVLLPVLSIFYLRLRRVRDFVKVFLGLIGGLVVYVVWLSVYGFDFAGSLIFYTPFTTVASELILTPYASKIGLATISAFVFCFILYMYWNVVPESLFEVVLGFLLVYMAFFDWWPQYLLWLIPFMTVDLILRRKWSRFYFVALLVSAFLFGLIMFEFAPLNSAFFIPASTRELDALSRFVRGIHNDIIMVLVGSPILRSIFAGVAVVYSAEICLRNSPRLRRLLGSSLCRRM